MPETSEKILAQLGDGKVTEKPEILFARLDVEEVMKKVEELHPQMTAEEKENQAAYLSRLQDAVENVYADLEDSKTRYRLSDIHRMALTVMACGGDPENFGTDPDGNPINLIRDTVWNSLWGDPGDQGINGYIWALLTIDAKNYQEPEGAEWTRDKIISELLSRQLADGGFGLVKTDPSDVDLTSMTLTALAPYQGQDKTYTVVNIVTNEEETVTVDEVAEQIGRAHV